MGSKKKCPAGDPDGSAVETEEVPRRLLINEVDLEGEGAIPEGYRRVYRIPGTCTFLYCKRPLNYILGVLEWVWRVTCGIVVRSFFWIPKHILYRGEFRD